MCTERENERKEATNRYTHIYIYTERETQRERERETERERQRERDTHLCVLLFIYLFILQVRGYPTLILYYNGARLGEHNGARGLEDLYSFVMRHIEGGRDEL